MELVETEAVPADQPRPEDEPATNKAMSKVLRADKTEHVDIASEILKGIKARTAVSKQPLQVSPQRTNRELHMAVPSRIAKKKGPKPLLLCSLSQVTVSGEYHLCQPKGSKSHRTRDLREKRAKEPYRCCRV